MCWRASSSCRYSNLRGDLFKTGQKSPTEICVECNGKHILKFNLKVNNKAADSNTGKSAVNGGRKEWLRMC